MARRFIVHVGAPKTGTSAFQEWAVENRARLADAGYLYTAVGATPGGNHAALVSALAGAIEDPARTSHLVRLFERELQDHPEADVILSSEMMTSLRFMPNMPRLYRALARHTEQATVVLVVRDQIAWRNSCYAQAREMLTPLPPFREYIKIGRHGPRGGNWHWLEQKYRTAGFDVAPLAFDRRVRERGIVAALASLDCLAGLAPIAGNERREANPSVGDLALLVAERVRAAIAGPGSGTGPGPGSGGELPAGLRPKLMPIIARHARRFPVVPFNGFDQDLADQIRAAYLPSNELFAARHFGCAWQELFPPIPVAHVSPDDIAALTPAQRSQVSAAAGRVLIEAIDADIVQVSARRQAG